MAPRRSFSTVVWLRADLEDGIDDLENKLRVLFRRVPRDVDQTITALITYCRRSVGRANNSRRRHRRDAIYRFFDWIWLGVLSIDRIAQHENELEDCRRAVKLAVETIKAFSRAHERRRRFNDVEQDEQHREQLRGALQQTGSQNYLLRMIRAEVDLAALRQLARNILDPHNPNSTSTLSSSSTLRPLQDQGYSRQPDPHLRMPSSEPIPPERVFLPRHEHGSSACYPYSWNSPTAAPISSQVPRMVHVLPPENDVRQSLYYPHESNSPVRAQSPDQLPSIVDLRKREREVFQTDFEHGKPLERSDKYRDSHRTHPQHPNSDGRRKNRHNSNPIVGDEPAQDYVSRRRRSSTRPSKGLPTVSDRDIDMNEHQIYPPQPARHNPEPRYIVIEPQQPNESNRRRSSQLCGSDNRQAEHQGPAQESPSASHRETSRHKTTYINKPTSYQQPQANDHIHPQSSTYYPPQTNRRKNISKNRPVGTEDEQRTRKTSKIGLLSLNHEELQQTERGRKRSRSRRSSSINQGDDQQIERSRSSSVRHGHQRQTESSKRTSTSRSSYDSAVYIKRNSSRHSVSDQLPAREPHVNRTSRPPISTLKMPSTRTSSTSSYDSGIFMSNSPGFGSRSESTDRSSAPKSPASQQSHVHRSYPPPSYYFDGDRPERHRRSSKKR